MKAGAVHFDMSFEHGHAVFRANNRKHMKILVKLLRVFLGTPGAQATVGMG
jgi:hypothetical protein